MTGLLLRFPDFLKIICLESRLMIIVFVWSVASGLLIQSELQTFNQDAINCIRIL